MSCFEVSMNNSFLKDALRKLILPASEESVQEFMKQVSGQEKPPYEIHFNEFARFAIAREKELLQTFTKLDRNNYGFIGERDLAKALNNMGYRNLSRSDVQRMLKRIKTGKGPFSKGGGLLSKSNDSFQAQGKAIDFYKL